MEGRATKYWQQSFRQLVSLLSSLPLFLSFSTIDFSFSFFPSGSNQLTFTYVVERKIGHFKAFNWVVRFQAVSFWTVLGLLLGILFVEFLLCCDYGFYSSPISWQTDWPTDRQAESAVRIKKIYSLIVFLLFFLQFFWSDHHSPEHGRVYIIRIFSFLFSPLPLIRLHSTTVLLAIQLERRLLFMGFLRTVVSTDRQTTSLSISKRLVPQLLPLRQKKHG